MPEREPPRAATPPPIVGPSSLRVRGDGVPAIQILPAFVEFSDGVSGEVDLSTRLFGSVFEPLKDPTLFAAVQLDEFGAPRWPNGADLAPDAIYERLRRG